MQDGVELSRWLRAMARQCELHQLRGKRMTPGEWRIFASALYRASDQAEVLERRLRRHAEAELRRICGGGGAA